ncbi:heavy-metal-associated domain-containing protein [Ascidiimonas aurantiaca]|uniref:heavy-metal-associated domain-containing protein n=1 Tax=Ascidiimonas aurantiaca TaxID=1685432 RepID=UPI0030EBC782
MKKTILLLIVLAGIAVFSCKKESKEQVTDPAVKQSEETKTAAITETAFGVRGNCTMCKATIEKAASLEGVSSAVWDVDKKRIEVVFDNNLVSVAAIHEAIASSGYDTEEYTGNEDAYNELPECCKYDRDMAMNQSGKPEK